MASGKKGWVLDFCWLGGGAGGVIWVTQAPGRQCLFVKAYTASSCYGMDYTLSPNPKP